MIRESERNRDGLAQVIPITNLAQAATKEPSSDDASSSDDPFLLLFPWGNNCWSTERTKCATYHTFWLRRDQQLFPRGKSAQNEGFTERVRKLHAITFTLEFHSVSSIACLSHVVSS